jgi:hypothetical protein
MEFCKKTLAKTGLLMTQKSSAKTGFMADAWNCQRRLVSWLTPVIVSKN